MKWERRGRGRGRLSSERRKTRQWRHCHAPMLGRRIGRIVTVPCPGVGETPTPLPACLVLPCAGGGEDREGQDWRQTVGGGGPGRLLILCLLRGASLLSLKNNIKRKQKKRKRKEKHSKKKEKGGQDFAWHLLLSLFCFTHARALFSLSPLFLSPVFGLSRLHAASLSIFCSFSLSLSAWPLLSFCPF